MSRLAIDPMTPPHCTSAFARQDTKFLGFARDIRKQAENIADNLTTIELSVSGHFMDEYIAGLFLPHTNLSAFPTVAKARGIILESTA